MMVMANVMSNNTNSDGVHEAHLHIANKNLSYDSNRPDFGHDHNFVTADLHIYSHWRNSQNNSPSYTTCKSDIEDIASKTMVPA